MNIAIILAGGVGNRVGADIPKQFIEVLGKPILAYTIEIFQQHPEIDAIEVVCIDSYIKDIGVMKSQYNFSKLIWVTKGGENFQKSVLNGIKYLKNKISENDIVLVHFGVSPFISEDIISDVIRVCKEKGNAISSTDFYLLPGMKENSESVENPNNASSKYIDRNTIACMSCPHAFKYGFDSVEPHTTTLMYKMRKTIYFSKGSQTNIKITNLEDINLFEGYLLMKESHKQKKNKYRD